MAIIGLGPSWLATYDAALLISTKGALITDMNWNFRMYMRVTDGTFSIAFVADKTDNGPNLFSAHHEIGMVASHSIYFFPSEI